MFSQKWFQPNVSIILNRFSPIYTEVRDQETRKELSRANFLISFPPFFVTKYGRIIIQHCHGWLSIGIGFLRHLSVRYNLIYCGTKVRSDILHTCDSQRYWVYIFAQKTKTKFWGKEIQKKVWWVFGFFYIKRPVQCCIYKVTK